MGPKLMNCCKLEQVGTKEHGKMLKRIQVLEDGRVPAMEARSSKIEGQKRRITSKEYQRLLSKFEMEGFMAQKGLWNLVTGERYLRKERGVTSLESTNKAMRQENFLSCWLREDGKDKDEIII